MRYTTTPEGITLQMETNGDGRTDLLPVDGVISLQASAFILWEGPRAWQG